MSAAGEERARVLVVDDDPVVRATLAELLGEFEVKAVGSISRAREELRRGEYRVVLVDFELGDGRGTTILAELEQRPATSRILLTGCADFPEVRTLQREGNVLVVFKPFDPEQLLIWVRHGVAMGKLASLVRRKGDSGRHTP